MYKFDPLLWPNSTLGRHYFHNFILPDNATTSVSVFLAKWFLRTFLKISQNSSIIPKKLPLKKGFVLIFTTLKPLAYGCFVPSL